MGKKECRNNGRGRWFLKTRSRIVLPVLTGLCDRPVPECAPDPVSVVIHSPLVKVLKVQAFVSTSS